jgi:hypothetical protein
LLNWVPMAVNAESDSVEEQGKKGWKKGVEEGVKS